MPGLKGIVIMSHTKIEHRKSESSYNYYRIKSCNLNLYKLNGCLPINYLHKGYKSKFINSGERRERGVCAGITLKEDRSRLI